MPQAVNWLYAGPKATETMFERHRLERLEGKGYDEANVSLSCVGISACSDGLRSPFAHPSRKR